MSETVFFILISVCLVAVIVECFKKGFSSINEGRLKTILSKSVIIAVAMILSCIVVVVCYLADVLYGDNPIIMALYIPIVFVGQWFVDMKIVKKIFEKIIEKVLNRL